eukprot:gene14869-4974_t
MKLIILLGMSLCASTSAKSAEQCASDFTSTIAIAVSTLDKCSAADAYESCLTGSTDATDDQIQLIESVRTAHKCTPAASWPKISVQDQDLHATVGIGHDFIFTRNGQPPISISELAANTGAIGSDVASIKASVDAQPEKLAQQIAAAVATSADDLDAVIAANNVKATTAQDAIAALLDDVIAKTESIAGIKDDLAAAKTDADERLKKVEDATETTVKKSLVTLEDGLVKKIAELRGEVSVTVIDDLWEYDERCSVFTPPNCLGERDTLGVAE